VGANPERDDLLRAIVAADLAVRPKRESFRVERPESHAGPLLSHSGFDREAPECNRQDLEDLHAQGLIRLEKKKRTVQQRGRAPRMVWEEWFFDVTDAGFEKVDREHRAAADADRDSHEGGRGGYDWETEALPVLEAVYAASGP
jgi:hypothetical protein